MNCTVFYGTDGQGIRQEFNLNQEVIMASLLKRGSVYYLSYYVGGKEIRTSLDTDSFQMAKKASGNSNPPSSAATTTPCRPGRRSQISSRPM